MNTKTSLSSSLLLSTLVAGLVCVSTGCDRQQESNTNLLAGAWESDERLQCDGIGSYNDYNQLFIGENNLGEATLHFASWYGEGVECSFADFDVRAFELGGGEYRLQFDCQDENALGFSCSDLDTNIDCRVFGGNVLSCAGDGAWEDYDFEFERTY